MATTEKDIEQAVEAIVQTINTSGWAVLVNGVTPLLNRVMAASGSAALVQLKIPDEKQIELTAVVNQDAVEYAAERGGELIRTISENTREMVRSTIRQALEEGWSAKQLGDAVEQNYAFAPARARMIGRTEIAQASEAGTLAGWRRSGVVDGVRWMLGSEHDDDVPAGDECDDNADAGVIAIGESFPSGDEAPPAHPNCVCALEAVLSQEGSQ